MHRGYQAGGGATQLKLTTINMSSQLFNSMLALSAICWICEFFTSTLVRINTNLFTLLLLLPDCDSKHSGITDLCTTAKCCVVIFTVLPLWHCVVVNIH